MKPVKIERKRVRKNCHRKIKLKKGQCYIRYELICSIILLAGKNEEKSFTIKLTFQGNIIII